jgi:hypothetical protein
MTCNLCVTTEHCQSEINKFQQNAVMQGFAEEKRVQGFSDRDLRTPS